MGLCLVFLDKLLMAETSLPIASFEWNPILDNNDSRHTKYMIIDA